MYNGFIGFPYLLVVGVNDLMEGGHCNCCTLNWLMMLVTPLMDTFSLAIFSAPASISPTGISLPLETRCEQQ